jgi:ethanolamine utilization cobalamin adenosyltransferase
MSLKILTHPITMIDAILEYCSDKNIEVETAATLITPRMKSMIEGEAMKLKMIAQKARLPIEEEI